MAVSLVYGEILAHVACGVKSIIGIIILEESGITVRGVIGAFREGRPVFANSALYSHSHVQISVRDLSLIAECRILPPSEVPNVRKINDS
jgi:hypothetical protein